MSLHPEGTALIVISIVRTIMETELAFGVMTCRFLCLWENMFQVLNKILKYFETSQLFPPVPIPPLWRLPILYSKIETSNNHLEKVIAFFIPLFSIAKVVLL